MKKIRKITEFESTRDYLRYLVKALCERLEINDIDAYKLSSKEDCIKCIENIVKNYNSAKDNQALYKEIDALKEEVEILTNANFEAEKENRNLQNYIESNLIFFAKDEKESKFKKIIEISDVALNISFVITFIVVMILAGIAIYKIV